MIDENKQTKTFSFVNLLHSHEAGIIRGKNREVVHFVTVKHLSCSPTFYVLLDRKLK